MKYDDFGRPIYETAEEYNKANRARKMSYAYTNPDGDVYESSTVPPKSTSKTATQRHAMRAGSKNAKKLIVGLIAFAVAINVSIVLIMLNAVGGFSGGSYEDQVDDWITSDDEFYEEYLREETTPLPESYETFIYNGKVISLPTTVEELSELRFDMDTEYSKNEMIPYGYNEMVDLIDEDGNSVAYVSIDNYTEEEISFSKCTVDYICIQNPAVYDYEEDIPDLEFGNGLTFESTYEEIEAYFGIPNYHYEDHSEEGSYYDCYEWNYYGECETQHLNVTFWNGEISNISIQKSIEEEIY